MTLPAGVRSAGVVVHGSPDARAQSDWLAEEVPVALVFNGISHAVMMASPSDLHDFALGFGITEGLLAHPGELYGLEVSESADGISVHLSVAAACEWRLKERRRTLAGRTGCGLCGTDSLAEVRRTLPACPVVTFTAAAFGHALQALSAQQAIQHLTGATHAAAWCAPNGETLIVREDVGRHNALDKVAGALLRSPWLGTPGFACITSRASFEMVQKAAMMGAGALAAVSAPTAMAVDTAKACGLPLAGFLRGENFVAYAFPERLGLRNLLT
ncbi:formate dehydrogenase accessory sulfurtransferase FdhD [Ottowia thiooxydans]|uniref:formate dehydrogenase accessory sulfurtransferase FdhD n=1 Tax=Ottowia thiooxydans TaxID=219182 RepID=UPI0003FB349B|nr:formate dehydrogenase accessory sulfurtransferase FdhD [Ottowia thiooxydans]